MPRIHFWLKMPTINYYFWEVDLLETASTEACFFVRFACCLIDLPSTCFTEAQIRFRDFWILHDDRRPQKRVKMKYTIAVFFSTNNFACNTNNTPHKKDSLTKQFPCKWRPRTTKVIPSCTDITFVEQHSFVCIRITFKQSNHSLLTLLTSSPSLPFTL
jgi:hypothetical protein